jgi:hypothetical protein
VQKVNRQCDNCSQKNSCQEAFKKLGDSEAPPVLLKVVQAFLLPLIIFIITLAVMEQVLLVRLNSPLGRNLIALAAAVIMVGLYIVVLKLWRTKH